MVIGAWILTVLSYLGGGAIIAVGITNPYILYSSGSVAEGVITGVIVFLVFGFIGHILSTQAVNCKKKGGAFAAFVISFLPYVLPTVAIMLLTLILRIIDWIVFTITDNHIVAEFVNKVTDSLIGNQFRAFKDAGTVSTVTTVYTVFQDGFERVLTPISTLQDSDPDSVYYLKYYTYLKDDIGNYWRSYDYNETFIADADIVNKNALKKIDG